MAMSSGGGGNSMRVKAVAAFVLLYWIWFLTSSSSIHHSSSSSSSSSWSPTGSSSSSHPTDDVNAAPDNNFEAATTTTQLVQHARRAQVNDTVILLYASYSYRDTLFNWLVAFRHHGSHTAGGPLLDPSSAGVLVICLDQALSDYLESLHWHCYLHESVKPGVSLDKRTVKSLWVTRVTHVLELLRHKISVVLTDSDAVWLHDIRPTLWQDGSDIVSSRANFPYNSPWGSTLCMGLVYFRANPQTVRLAELALVQTVRAQDDQIGFNRALLALKPVAVGVGVVKSKQQQQQQHRYAFGGAMPPEGRRTGHASFLLPALRRTTTTTTTDTPSSSSTTVSVSLLAHTIVARVCSSITPEEWTDQVHVAHCHVHDGVPAATLKEKGNPQSHTEILVKYGVFYLRPAWEQALEEAKITSFADVLDVIKEETRRH